jgi:lipid II:glycine glycyltransferase (peptidoglycan interpeptide bridge formation enzyme)
MIVIKSQRGPFKLVDIFYPREYDLSGLSDHLGLNHVIHVRQAPVPPKSDRYTFRYLPFVTSLIDLTRDSEELFKRMNATSRNEIRKIERIKHRVCVRKNDCEAYQDFLLLHNQFVALKRHREKLSYWRLEALKPFCDVLVAYVDGKAKCAHLVVRDLAARRVGLLLSVSTRLNGGDAPAFVGSMNRWLHWYELHQYGLEGIRTYDFGGIGTDTPEVAEIARFKLSFGGSSVIEHNYMIAHAAGRAATGLFYMVRYLRTTGWLPYWSSAKTTRCGQSA